MSCDCSQTRHFRWGPTRFTSSGENDLLLSVDLGGAREVSGTLTVLGVSGSSPTLDVVLIDGPENDALYMGDTTSGAFTQMSSTGNTKLYITEFSRFMNYKVSLGGSSPEFTVVIDLYSKG